MDLIGLKKCEIEFTKSEKVVLEQGETIRLKSESMKEVDVARLKIKVNGKEYNIYLQVGKNQVLREERLEEADV